MGSLARFTIACYILDVCRPGDANETQLEFHNVFYL